MILVDAAYLQTLLNLTAAAERSGAIADVYMSTSGHLTTVHQWSGQAPQQGSDATMTGHDALGWQTVDYSSDGVGMQSQPSPDMAANGHGTGWETVGYSVDGGAMQPAVQPSEGLSFYGSG